MLNLTYTFCRTYAPPLFKWNQAERSTMKIQQEGRYKYRRESLASQVEQRIHAQHNLIGERMTSLVISSQNHLIYYGFLRHSKEEVFRSTRLNKVEIQLLFRKPYSLLDDTRNESQQGPPRSLKREERYAACLRLVKGIFPSFSTCFSIPSAPLEKNPRHLFTDKKNRQKEWVGLIHDLNHQHLLSNHSPLLFVVKLIPRSDHPLHQMSLFYAFMVERLNQDK